MNDPILMKPPYEIVVPDISNWQNFTQYGQPTKIDYAKVATNPKIRAIMVKFGEGSWEGYPLDVALDQANGFHNVGLPVIPYEFWHFEVNPLNQAKYFKNRVNKLSWKPRRQMVDIEDTDHPDARPPKEIIPISDYPIWIPKARRIAISVRDTFDAVAQEFGDAPIWYGGDWYQTWWTQMAYIDGLDMSWIKDYSLQCASYTSPYMYLPFGFKMEQVLFWQWTSRPKEEEQIQGFPYPAALDLNYWLLSQTMFEDYIKEEGVVTTMSGIYDKSISNKDKWGGIWLGMEDKNINLTNVCAGSDFLLMNCVSQICDGIIPQKDSAFPIWTERASKPVGMVIDLDQDLFWKKEIPLPIFQDPTKRNLWTNETMRAILEQWRRSVITNYEWDNKNLNINALDGGWHPVSAIVFRESVLRNHGDFINGMWQTAVLDDLLKPLTTLMEGSYIPRVPIYLMANKEWYSSYSNDNTWKMKDRFGAGQLKGFGMIRTWGEEGIPNVIITDKAPMSQPYLPMMEDVWQYKPSDSYVYPWSEPGINYDFYVFSFNRFMVEDIFYSGSPITPITTIIGAKKVADLYSVLGWNGETVPPTGEITTLAQAIEAIIELRAWREKIRGA